jgi:hypothetical protein
MITEATQGTIMSSGNVAAAGQKTNRVKPTTTFSGRTDVDAAELVKTPAFQELLRRVRIKKQRAKAKEK